MQNLKNRYIRYYPVLLMHFFCLTGIAQISYNGDPYISEDHNIQGIEFYHLEASEVLSAKYLTRQTGRNDPFKIEEYAGVSRVNITPGLQGKWIVTKNGMHVWQLGFTSLHASSLSVTVDPFELQPGCKLWVYTPGGRQVLGAFTFRNNNSSRVLSISDLPGDSIVVELQLCSSLKNYGKFTIATVGVGYPPKRDTAEEKDGYYGWSADCEIDINCIDDRDVQLQKHAVCRLITERSSGKIRCTGTLINNTAGDGHPYVLTAGHCVSDMYSANRTVFYFDYESPYCNGPDGDIKSMSGSELISRNDYLDFALLELHKKPPVEYSPLFAGWDASGNGFDTSYIIHHPEGDVKKYTQNTELVEIGSFSQFDPLTHWVIEKYSVGTTENGSSGAPLFDNNNRLTGSLTGGGLACSEFIYDYYQRFVNCWNDYLAPDQQLKHWLDPGNTGITQLDNLDPYFGITEELSNMQQGDTLKTVNYNGWGYISGHNSGYATQFAEQYFRNGTKYLYGLKMHIAKVYANNPDSRIILKVWNGDDYPLGELFAKNVYPFELNAGEENYIRFDTLIKVDFNFFIGYEIEYSTPLDTFALSTAIHTDTSVLNTAFTYLQGQWQPLTNGIGMLNASLAMSPLALDFYPPSDVPFSDYPSADITIYPNPTFDNIQILLKNKIDGEMKLTVYDLNGKMLFQKSVIAPEPNYELKTNILSQGIFILKIEYPGHSFIRKFVKLKRDS